MVKLIKTGEKNGITKIELVPSDPKPKKNIIKIEPKKKRELQHRRGGRTARPKGGWTPGV